MYIMKKDVRDTEIPEFKTLEEEKEYWEARGPLAEGHRGIVNKPKQKRSSFLAVRLTGEELTRLRDIAAKQGLGPSTFARMLLTSAIERQSQPDMVTLTELKNMMENFLSQPMMDKGEAIGKKTA
jgi:antitoxin component of RelBE/YafQ-DinJ toxin-antitoxin module